MGTWVAWGGMIWCGVLPSPTGIRQWSWGCHPEPLLHSLWAPLKEKSLKRGPYCVDKEECSALSYPFLISGFFDVPHPSS